METIHFQGLCLLVSGRVHPPLFLEETSFLKKWVLQSDLVLKKLVNFLMDPYKMSSGKHEEDLGNDFRCHDSVWHEEVLQRLMLSASFVTETIRDRS